MPIQDEASTSSIQSGECKEWLRRRKGEERSGAAPSLCPSLLLLLLLAHSSLSAIHVYSLQFLHPKLPTSLSDRSCTRACGSTVSGGASTREEEEEEGAGHSQAQPAVLQCDGQLIGVAVSSSSLPFPLQA